MVEFKKYFDKVKESIEILEIDIDYFEKKGTKVTKQDKQDLLDDIQEVRENIYKLSTRIKNTAIIK